jgi:HK97 family phage major capsid protein
MLHISPLEFKDDEADPSAVVTKALDELRNTVDGRLKAVETKASASDKLTDRLDKLEAKLNRPAAGNESDADGEIERKAFNSYLRHGDRVSQDEIKTLTVSGDPQGGYLAPAETSTEFIRDLVEFSPIRALATVRPTSAPSVSYPKRTGVTNAKWKGETQASEGSEPTFGQIEIPTREVNTYVDISNQLLADSAGVAEAEVRLALAEDFGKKEGLAFVKGVGPLAPEGLLSNADVLHTASGQAATLGANDAAVADLLISHFYSLQAGYRSRGTWLMNGTTLAAIRKLKSEGSFGMYLWQPAYAAGAPETILGRPVIEVPDMDSIGANAVPILFGDVASAYRIIDRLALSILVNPYIQATNGITRIHATRRVGAAVVRPAAIRKIKCATT